MKIAVTYDNGEIFQHFGRTESFKIYEIEDGKVISSEVIGTDGTGHEALAGFLADKGVSAIICGGMGAGAQNALANAGIKIFAGVSGNADEAVQAYVNGELIADGTANCDHHHEEEESGCGSGCGSSCGGGCGSCGGGCGAPQPIMEGKNVGKTCRVNYRGTFNDGKEFDSSYGRGETLDFICGVGMMIKGFDQAVANMEVGEKVNIHLMPEDAYGMPNPDAILTIEISKLPGSENLEVGQQVYLTSPTGQPFPVTVTAKDDVMITLDANHEMAGKELNFEIELVEVVEEN